jgi:GNAT superfamily N-acetyltransferase
VELKYTSPLERAPGIISRLLDQSYAELVRTHPELREPEKENWEKFDRDVFENPDTIGACTFLSWCGKDIVGFFSFDPRSGPAYGVIGHNCILSEYRNRGFGKRQIAEILRRFRQMGIGHARVSTSDHPFFVPAQKMYTAFGFVEVKRVPFDRDPKQNMIHYEMKIG